jgi:1-acyl-sn-glycerol-3-phosphate acyltransferase
MSHLRALVRLVALLVVTTFVVIGVRLELAWRGRDSEAGLRAGQRWLRRWCRGCSRALGMRIDVTGPVPQGSFILVSNHLSYCDIFLLGAIAAPFFVSKAEVGRWPVLGAVVRSAGCLFLDRRRIRDLPRVIEDMERIRDAGIGLVFFPEGTTSDGSGVAPFRAPLMEVASRAKRPVHYGALRYETPPGSRSARSAVCWWGDMTLVDHLWGLLRLPNFRAEVRFGDAPIVDGDRKRLAERTHEAVSALFVPVPDGPAEAKRVVE